MKKGLIERKIMIAMTIIKMKATTIIRTAIVVVK